MIACILYIQVFLLMICSSNAVISVDDRLHTYFPAFVTRNTLSARVESSQTHESHVTLAVPLLNSTFEFILEENYGMLSGTYVSLELTAEGESSVLTTAEHDVLKHYHGSIVSEVGSQVALSMNLRNQVVAGWILMADGGEYFIELSHSHQHIVYRGVDVKSSVVSGCTEWTHPGTLSQAIARATVQSANAHLDEAVVGTAYVECLLVNDFQRYTALSSGTSADSLSLFNIMQTIYQSAFAIQLVLQGQVTFTVQDPYSPAMAGVEVVLAGNTGLLDLFNAWHTSALNIPVHDVGLLLSGFNFLGLVAGLAAIGGMCVKGYSGAIVQTTFSGPFNAVLVAHELGHTLGAWHDSSNGNACPASGYIMNAMMIGTPQQWSSCSVAYIQNYLATPTAACLQNAPVSAPITTLPPVSQNTPSPSVAFTWVSGALGLCAASLTSTSTVPAVCGPNTNTSVMVIGSQTLTVQCVSSTSIVVPDLYCALTGAGDKPPTVQTCWLLVQVSNGGTGLPCITTPPTPASPTVVPPLPISTDVCSWAVVPMGTVQLPSPPLNLITGAWSACTVACGGGSQFRYVVCSTVVPPLKIVADALCLSASKPAILSSCNVQPCSVPLTSSPITSVPILPVTTPPPTTTQPPPLPVATQPSQNTATWYNWAVLPLGTVALPWPPLDITTGGWSACSVSCGGGFQVRYVVCATSTQPSQIVADTLCSGAPKPAIISSTCNAPMTTPTMPNPAVTITYSWTSGTFGMCNPIVAALVDGSSCAAASIIVLGTQTRVVSCISSVSASVAVAHSNCQASMQPFAVVACNPLPAAITTTDQYSHVLTQLKDTINVPLGDTGTSLMKVVCTSGWFLFAAGLMIAVTLATVGLMMRYYRSFTAIVPPAGMPTLFSRAMETSDDTQHNSGLEMNRKSDSVIVETGAVVNHESQRRRRSVTMTVDHT